MFGCCSVSFSISLWSIIVISARFCSSEHTPDQDSSIPNIGTLNLNESYLVDTYDYFCHDDTHIFNGLVQCNLRKRKVVVPPFFCVT